MTSMLIAPADLSHVLSGGPSLILAAGLPKAEEVAASGLDLWVVSEGVLHRPGAEPAESAVPLGFAPLGVVAILVAEEEQAVPLLRWWHSVTDEPPPPLLAAPDSRAALAGLAGILARALGSAESRCAALLGQLAATRQDYEETRTAMAAVTRVLGQRPPAGLKTLLSTRPSQTGLKVGNWAPGRSLLLTQTMGVKVAGLAALALHLAEAAIADPAAAVLRLRLLGAESGRVLGAWDVPGAALAPGWLALDLPSPIGPVAETARLAVTAELGPDDVLAFSLDDLATSQALAVAGPEVPRGDRALAMKLWISEYGNRFIAARHWNWDEAGLDLPMEATPFALPAEAWREVRVLSGNCRLIALGEEAPRPVAMLASGAETLVLLPLPATLPAAEVLRLDLSLQLGEPGQVQAAAWILPAGAAVADLRDLSAALRWSGWRGFGSEDTSLSITLSLPPRAPRTDGLRLAVLLRNSGRNGACSVEIGGLSVMAMPAAAPAAIAPIPPAAPAAAAIAAPSIAAARVNEHFRGKGGYEHFDITLAGLEASADGIEVKQLRFKIHHSGGPMVIEFRRAAGWPDVFDRWREVRSDEWGSIFELSAATAGKVLEGIEGTRDGALLAALLELLPAIAARAARGRNVEREQVEAWAERARIFAEQVSRVVSSARPAEKAAS